MEKHERISMNPLIMLGKPVIRGTRIPVELILRILGDGGTEAYLLNAYPSLTPEDIRAAIVYAADVVASTMDREKMRESLLQSMAAQV